MFTQSKVYISALVVLSSLYDGVGIGTMGSGLMVRAAPTPQRQGVAARNVVERKFEHESEPRKVNFRRQDAGDGDGDTLGKLIRDYNVLKAAIPAAPDGSDLQNALIQEVDQRKETIFQKFGKIIPDVGTASDQSGATTVNSADGALVTIFPVADGSIIIASNGQNQTVSLSPTATTQAGAGDQQAPPTSTSSPTSTSTAVVVSTSTASASGTTTLFNPPVTASATTASASASRSNAAVVARPLDMLPTSMAMKSLFTVTVTMVLGAWSVL